MCQYIIDVECEEQQQRKEEMLDLVDGGPILESEERQNGFSWLESGRDHKNLFLYITFLSHNALIYRSLHMCEINMAITDISHFCTSQQRDKLN